MFSLLKRMDKFFDKYSKALLVLMGIFIILISLLSILLRWFEFNILWPTILVRHMVFFSIFVAASIGLSKIDGHISIDLLRNFKDHRLISALFPYLNVIMNLFTITTLIILFFAFLNFTKIEYQFGREIYFGLASGDFALTTAFGVLLMVLRSFIKLLEEIISLVNVNNKD